MSQIKQESVFLGLEFWNSLSIWRGLFSGAASFCGFAVLFCAFFVLAGAPARAAVSVDVTCRNRDCLRDGWMARASDGSWSETVCRGPSCEDFGWEVRGAYGTSVVVRCLAGGCFTAGWREFVAGRPGSQVYRCGSDPNSSEGQQIKTDCLRFGWKAEGPYQHETVQCISGSCATNGWTAANAAIPETAIATCKSGRDTNGTFSSSCFRFGWSLYFER